MFDNYLDKDSIEIALKSNFKSNIEPTNPLRTNEYVNTMIIPKLTDYLPQIEIDDITITFSLHYTVSRFWIRVNIYKELEDSYDKIIDAEIINKYKSDIIAKIINSVNRMNEAEVEFVNFEGTDNAGGYFKIFNGIIFGAMYDIVNDKYIELAKPIKTKLVFEEPDASEIQDKLLSKR